MREILAICTLMATTMASTSAQEAATVFTEEELSVAEFWKQMGPVLRDQGVEAYAIRYHPDFRHWDINGAGGISTKESAVRYWSKFHEDGHRITCTHVDPVTIDIVGQSAFARLVYEQTNTYADGREPTTGAWRMFDVFERYGDTWQVLESNMVNITPDLNEPTQSAAAAAYQFKCPGP